MRDRWAERPGCWADPSSAAGAGPAGGVLRVLAVCDRAPGSGTRTSDGNTLISREVLLRLASQCQLTLAWFQEPGVEPDRELMGRCRRLIPLPLASRVMAARGMLSAVPGSVLRRSAPQTVKALREAAEQVDVVYLHGPGTLGLAGRLARPVVANEVDPMSLVFGDLANRVRGPRRVAMAVRRRNARGIEERSRAVEELLLVNHADAAELGTILGRTIRAVPNGVAPSRQGPRPAMDASRICFVGALDYAPNIDSATMLARDVLPVVRQQVPEATVVLAGRAARPEVQALAGPHVQVLSDVPDVMATYASSAVAAFPGGQGRGTRNSVLEALRAGVPVVASQVSARGIGRGPHLRVAGSAAEVAHELTQLLTQPLTYSSARQAAADYGAALPTWDTVAAEYLSVLAAAAAQRHGPAGPRRAGEGEVAAGAAPPGVGPSGREVP